MLLLKHWTELHWTELHWTEALLVPGRSGLFVSASCIGWLAAYTSMQQARVAEGNLASLHPQLCGNGRLFSRLGLETAQRSALLDRQNLVWYTHSVHCVAAYYLKVRTASWFVHVAASVDRHAVPPVA